MTSHGRIDSLHRLARLYRVSTVFEDGFRVLRHAEPEAICAVLRSLGAPLASLDDAPMAVRARRLELWDRIVEPVVVSWSPDPPVCVIRLDPRESSLDCELQQEDGTERAWTVKVGDTPARRSIEVEGRTFTVRTLTLPADLPLGYHRLHLRTEQRTAEACIFRAPRQAYPLREVRGTGWGVFLPLYSLHTEKSWGAGDFSDLGELARWTASLGGQVVGTLPLLAAFLDTPFDPSPYSPVSRLFWNEFFVDPAAVPEFENSIRAKDLISSSEFQADIDTCRAAPLVDYGRQMALKRRVLEMLCSDLKDGSSQRSTEFREYVDARPTLQAYAAFRATTERRRKAWPEWPERQHDGHLNGGDYDEQVRRYHLYVQWLADSQLRTIAQDSGSAGLYLDLPLGTHPGGFDAWREPDSFALGAAVGVPPDRFFAKGQNWGFAPVHPEKLRLGGYRHYIECLRHHMQYSRVLRIDHGMNLHRLYWIPQGFEATEGMYVAYRAEEFYAVLALESRRQQTAIVGEDLGTVPKRIRATMSDHAISRMYVAQLQFDPDADDAIQPTPENSLAGLNTHDMRPFAGFWKGLDIQDQEDLKLLEPQQAQADRERRLQVTAAVVRYLRQHGTLTKHDPALHDILEACLAELASRPESMMLVNLEDLWLEEVPQNTPGTVDERPNWRQRAGHSLEEIKAMRHIEELLRRIHHLRAKAAT